ncbi:MAG: hypothetical protein R3185_01555, partial [Candidatus Thermoplasmatota archaeon]|nr:hypothetical protein [Candidatus Thermoplasmatota archaeon]
MGERGGKPNAWIWTIVFATVAAVLAGITHAVLAYYTVTGASFDWLTWPRQQMLEPGEVAGSLMLATFTVTVLLASIAGSVAYWMAEKGYLRGIASKGRRGKDAAWSEFTIGQAIGYAVLGGLVLSLIGFGAANFSIGSWFPATEGIDGPAYFLLHLIGATVIATIAVAVITRALAHTHARGHIVAQNPNGNIISRIQLASARNATAVVIVVILLTAGLGY